MKNLEDYCIELFIYMLISGFFAVGILLFQLGRTDGFIVGSIMILGSYVFFKMFIKIAQETK